MIFSDSRDIASLCTESHLPEGSHPVLQNLSNPIFNQILTYTDQAVLLLNYSTFSFEYVSETIVNLTGIARKDFLSGGNDFLAGLTHADDLQYLNKVVYPNYHSCLQAVPASQWGHLKFCHTSRMRKGDGGYFQVLYQAVPLTFDAGSILLGMVTLTDISAYKKGHSVTYRNALVYDNGLPQVLSEGSCAHSIFSLREREILSLTARGFAEKQIAGALFLSPHTVKTHRKNMLKKAGVPNAAALIRFGMANLII